MLSSQHKRSKYSLWFYTLVLVFIFICAYTIFFSSGTPSSIQPDPIPVQIPPEKVLYDLYHLDPTKPPTQPPIRLLDELYHRFFTKVDTPPKLYSNERIVERTKQHYLSINVCNGFTNQLLALMDGIIMAHVLGMTLILPELYSNYDLPKADMQFDELFDQEDFIESMRSFVSMVPSLKINDTNGIKINGLEPIIISLGSSERKMFTPERLLNRLEEQLTDPTILFSSKPIVFTTDCTLFSMDVREYPDLWKKRWDMYESIRLRPDMMTYIDGIVKNELGNEFYGMHLRLENDWMEHCKNWDGNNCDITSTHTLDGHSYLYRALEIEKIPKDKVIYIASSMETRHLYQHPVMKEIYNTFTLRTNQEVRNRFVEEKFMKGRGIAFDTNSEPISSGTGNREIHAAIDFFILKHSTTFIGNSVSTFSAITMMYRKYKGLPFLQYNSGNIPLETIQSPPSEIKKPHQRLKWVFATNSESTHLFGDIQVAVLSAIKNTNLDMYCVYTGGENMVTDWLREHNVHIIQHQISIHDQLLELVDKKHAENYSPLFASSEGVLGTFARLDIPILGFMDEYILYTDTDIVFMKDIQVSDFGPSPKYVMCGAETEKEVKDICNAGILLINVRGMANTYDGYVHSILSNKNGLLFLHGPLDQGALNDFYAGKATYFGIEFNWKPYYTGWSYNSPYIIHFHGPKMMDYKLYLENNKVNRKAYSGLLKKCHLPDSGCKGILDRYNTYFQ